MFVEARPPSLGATEDKSSVVSRLRGSYDVARGRGSLAAVSQGEGSKAGLFWKVGLPSRSHEGYPTKPAVAGGYGEAAFLEFLKAKAGARGGS